MASITLLTKYPNKKNDVINPTQDNLLQAFMEVYNKEKEPQRLELLRIFSESYMLSWESWAT